MSDDRPDDLPMSIGEHLEELRGHVLKAIGWTFLALLVCLAFQEELLKVAKWPHEQMVEALRAEAETRESRARLAAARVEAAREAAKRDDKIARRLEEVERAHLVAREKARPTPDEALADLAARQEAALARLEALQRKLEAVADADPVDASRLEALERELAAARDEAGALSVEVARDVRPLLDSHANVPKAELVSLSPTDVFLTTIKLCLVTALFVAAPLIVWELWKFVARALYPHERKWVRIFGPLSYGAFLVGFMFGFLVLIPIGLRFLGSYAPADVAVTQYSVQGYMSLLITLSLVCGVIFELPLVMTFLALIGLVSADGFRAWRKYWILGAFIVGGILTPPDPFTQSLLAIPLLGLYEVGILMAAIFGRPAAPPEPEPALASDAASGAIDDRYPEVPVEETLVADPAQLSGEPADASPDGADATSPTFDPLAPRPAPEGTVAVGADPSDRAPSPDSGDDAPRPEGTRDP